jgi:hypothetical protein
LSKSKGRVITEDRIFVGIDWSKAPKQEEFRGAIKIRGAGRKETVYVQCFNPAIAAGGEFKGVFVEDNGVISISAANYHRKVESGGVTWGVINDLGITGKLVAMFPVTAEPASIPNAPRLEYDIYTFNCGVAEIHCFVLPVFAINSFRTAQYAVSIDDGRPQTIDISAPEYSGQWKDNIRRNASRNITRCYIEKPGKHTLKLWMVDTGMAFDKIIVDLGGLKMSYLGPDETRVR